MDHPRFIAGRIAAVAIPLSLTAIVLVQMAAGRLARAADTTPRPRYDPVERRIEGWPVWIAPDLLDEQHAELGERALAALANHLQRISYIVPEQQLAQLRGVRIWIERHNPGLTTMQYHPDRGWLLEHDQDPRLAKCVHIPRAQDLLERHTWAKHPYVVLHELAHAYHDQVLGFDDARIREAYRSAVDSGKYEHVLLYTGERVRHYGLTDHKEYFAESTEAYLGVNDFYPFVRAELEEFDPQMYSVLQQIWGPVR